MRAEATLINLTAHDPLIMIGPDGARVEVPQYAAPIRLAERTERIGDLLIDGIPIPLVAKGYGATDPVPEPAAGTWYVVAQLVVHAHPDREDLVFPADLMRDEHGGAYGCRALARPLASGEQP